MTRNLIARSLLVLALLFGLLYAVGTALAYKLHLPLGWAVGFSITVVALQYLLGPFILELFFDIRWVEPREVSPELEAFLKDLCRQRNIPIPRFGVIRDGNPNAFTFGHLPGNARVVVTQGLLDMLTPEERNAVVAHEIGHVAHYDFLVMALASVVPLILYNLYQWSDRARNQATFLVSIGAYAAYVISQLAVLVLSRLREYFADEHAVESVADANAISRALVKIAYGMARLPQEAQKKTKKDEVVVKPSRIAMLGALGISSMKGSGPLAMAAADGLGSFSEDRMGQAMRWDLWNPWATWYELFSTHPLVAHRVAAASKLAVRRGQAPLVAPLGDAPKDLRVAFLRDLLITFLPWIGVVLGLLVVGPRQLFTDPEGPWEALWRHGANFGPLLCLGGLGWILRLAFSYKSDCEPRTVASLMAEWDVSRIKPIPGTLKGVVIGRGVPGLFWSKDLVIQDETGFMVLLYQQPLGILETWFGLMKAESLIGQEVTVSGWFRRGPSPYFEANTIQTGDDSEFGCYYRHLQWFLAIVGIGVGLGLMLL